MLNSSGDEAAPARRGRPRGGSDAKARILAAARDAFGELGYRRATLRRIAANAGVDVALLNYHFGSKHGLFASVVAARVDPAERLAHALSAPPQHVPDVLASTVLDAYGDPASVASLRGVLAGALAGDADPSSIVEYLDGELASRIRQHLAGPAATERAAAAIAVIAGTIVTRTVLGLPTAVAADRAAYERRFAAMLRVALAPPAAPRPAGHPHTRSASAADRSRA